MNFEDQATDLAVQGTNNSSITSKRSLERLGYLETCHIPGITERDSPMMFKYVVPKPGRRSPVINRAYYQRTESIRILIEGWIKECETLGVDECAVISLGCGFDPTYFRLATIRENKQSRTRLKYVDIDYPTLITERLYMIRNQEKLFELLPEDPSKDDVGEFVSDDYSCLGVDLRKLDHLERGLNAARIVKGQGRMPILIISEVVLAYLEAEESDAVIQFFAGYPEATFILHEQCIPVFDADREEENLHPFALTMFNHFQKTMTPLKTLQNYRSLEDHRDRFQGCGWSSCDIINMNLFSDTIVMPEEGDHHRISQLEPFDEYDELYWIGSYYFIAVASTGPGDSSVPTRSPDVLREIGLRSKLQHEEFISNNQLDKSCYISLDPLQRPSPPPAIPAINVVWSEKNPFPGSDFNRKGHTLSILGDTAYIFGGFGLDAIDHQEDQRVFQARSQQTRLGSMVRLNLINGSTETLPLEDNGPAPRMHHSAVTTIDGSAIYMYGGRDGPTKVHNDVWRFTPEGGWDPLWRARINQASNSSAPPGLFKHTANMMMIAGREMMVVVGGRLRSGEANDQIWAFDLEEGQWGHFHWRHAEQRQAFGGIFSHSSVVVKDEEQQDCLVVLGGIRGSDEKVLNKVWRITLEVSEGEPQCRIEAREIDIRARTGNPLKPRFGHSSVLVGEDRIWVLGGVSAPALLQWQETMIEIQLSTGIFQHLNPSSFRELVMVGHATAVDKDRSRVIGVGGGGTCFGFGAWWDATGWALQI
ncbi:Leucine carboxyl methyltransferase 2 [Mortierella sp. AD011]|nr:Leucine carboxyl methyltransferase 2 [Mortierella sp. AD010]KAF9386337.1 Leucine carboxyl methyltransferase 2 [Mortierella sp. AD011]